MANRSVKDCRVGRKNCALLAMTNLVGFAGKRNNFRNEIFENGTISGTKRLKNDAEQYRAKNDRIKQKTSVFKQKRCNFMSLRGRSAAVAILKFEAWHPVAKHGSTKQEGSPITKKGIRCFIPLSRSSFQGFVSFHPTIVRSGMTNRFVKDCRVGRKNSALLAMTNLVSFAGKRNNFRNKTFENGTISGTKLLKEDAERYRAEIAPSSQ